MNRLKEELEEHRNIASFKDVYNSDLTLKAKSNL